MKNTQITEETLKKIDSIGVSLERDLIGKTKEEGEIIIDKAKSNINRILKDFKGK